MANKEFREIQVSSSLLVVIFLGVLALGVFIFLLGVSVGKKQSGAAGPTQIVTQQIPEPVKEPPVKPAGSDTLADPTASPASGAPSGAETPAAKPPASETAARKPAPPPAAVETKKTSAAPAAKGLYYVQVAAFTDKAQAQAEAERYRKQGYTVTVFDPKPADTRPWHRVRLGGYAQRDRAVSLLAKLNAAAGKTTDFRIVQD